MSKIEIFFHASQYSNFLTHAHQQTISVLSTWHHLFIGTSLYLDWNITRFSYHKDTCDWQLYDLLAMHLFPGIRFSNSILIQKEKRYIYRLEGESLMDLRILVTKGKGNVFCTICNSIFIIFKIYISLAQNLSSFYETYGICNLIAATDASYDI